jgi:hypothetical protein
MFITMGIFRGRKGKMDIISDIPKKIFYEINLVGKTIGDMLLKTRGGLPAPAGDVTSSALFQLGSKGRLGQAGDFNAQGER